MITKQSLRNSAKHLRDSFDRDYISSVSSLIVQKIMTLDVYKSAENIMIYYPIKSELSLLELLKDTSKTFYFPVVCENYLKVVQYIPDKGFSKGKFGIMEPVGEEIKNLSVLDCIFVPALMADENGYRIGYGCGYYDRFLRNLNKNVVKIVPVFSKFFTETVYPEKHDIPMDIVVSEEKIHAVTLLSAGC